MDPWGVFGLIVVFGGVIALFGTLLGHEVKDRWTPHHH